MTANDYAITLTIFSLAYAIFEVPSNWVMKHYVRPSVWLAFLLGCWGVVTIGFAGVRNYGTVLALRLLIGVFEAGFFPGIVYLITIWYRHDQRALRIALVIAFCNLAGAFGGAIAFGIGNVNGAKGLQGFRWLFIIEGLITVISVLPVLIFLPDYPARARFLSKEDKQLAIDRLKDRGGGYQRDHGTRHEILQTFFAPRMLGHYIAYASTLVFSHSLLSANQLIIGCQCRPPRLFHILLADYRHWSRLPVNSSSATDSPTMGSRVLCRYHFVLLCRQIQREGLACRRGVNCWGRGLVNGGPFACKCLSRAVWVPVSCCSWGFPMCSGYDKLGDM